MSEIHVQVVYALPREYDLLNLELPAGSTVQQAITKSGILARHADIDLARHKVGVFGKQVTLETALQNGDRVEIYRGLLADPKTARRKHKDNIGHGSVTQTPL